MSEQQVLQLLKSGRKPAPSHFSEPIAYGAGPNLYDPEEQETICDEVEDLIDYEFADRSLLRRALTHRSFSAEMNSRVARAGAEDVLATIDGDMVGPDGQVIPLHYEPLEFLGDRVLNLMTALRVFEHGQARGGEAMREALLSATAQEWSRNSSCEACTRALGIDLDRHIRIGRAHRRDAAHRNVFKMLADVFESLIGAVFLDSGQTLDEPTRLWNRAVLAALRKQQVNAAGEHDFSFGADKDRQQDDAEAASGNGKPAAASASASASQASPGGEAVVATRRPQSSESGALTAMSPAAVQSNASSFTVVQSALERDWVGRAQDLILSESFGLATPRVLLTFACPDAHESSTRARSFTGVAWWNRKDEAARFAPWFSRKYFPKKVLGRRAAAAEFCFVLCSCPDLVEILAALRFSYVKTFDQFADRVAPSLGYAGSGPFSASRDWPENPPWHEAPGSVELYDDVHLQSGAICDALVDLALRNHEELRPRIAEAWLGTVDTAMEHIRLLNRFFKELGLDPQRAASSVAEDGPEEPSQPEPTVSVEDVSLTEQDRARVLKLAKSFCWSMNAIKKLPLHERPRCKTHDNVVTKAFNCSNKFHCSMGSCSKRFRCKGVWLVTDCGCIVPSERKFAIGRTTNPSRIKNLLDRATQVGSALAASSDSGSDQAADADADADADDSSGETEPPATNGESTEGGDSGQNIEEKRTDSASPVSDRKEG
jgi:dsRNA-specific ribonuclease